MGLGCGEHLPSERAILVPGPDAARSAVAPSQPGSLTTCRTQLTGELQELRELEADLERQEREVDEDTTVTIPSAV